MSREGLKGPKAQQAQENSGGCGLRGLAAVFNGFDDEVGIILARAVPTAGRPIAPGAPGLGNRHALAVKLVAQFCQIIVGCPVLAIGADNPFDFFMIGHVRLGTAFSGEWRRQLAATVPD